MDLQDAVLKATVTVVNTASLCLEIDNKNEVINSEDVVVKAIHAITLLGKVNHQMSFERKESLKNAFLENYRTICEQDHSHCKQSLGDDLAVM